MAYKAPRGSKEFSEFHHDEPGVSRRDFIKRGLATGVLSYAASKLLMGDLVKEAYAATAKDVSNNILGGAIGHIYSQGGPSVGARFLSDAQAAMLQNPVSGSMMAANYGITGGKAMIQLGQNCWVDNMSPFGFTILQGPPGFPGGSFAWKSQVLANITMGGHIGPFTADDGAGQDTGLIGGASPFKASTLGKDLRLIPSGASYAQAAWTAGGPSSTVSGAFDAAALAKTVSLVPAADGLTNASAMTRSATAAKDLSVAMNPVTGMDKRKAASTVVAAASAAFAKNANYADPKFGSSLYDLSSSTLAGTFAGKVAAGSLTAAESAQTAAYYQSAIGNIGAVLTTYDGRDYHGQSGDQIAGADVEEARSFVMFLLACFVAGKKGSMIFTSNGNAICGDSDHPAGTFSGQAKVNANDAKMTTFKAPEAVGDAGGFYNIGFAIFYNPSGAGPSTNVTGGQIDASTGHFSAAVDSSQNAVAGLYLSAFQWVSPGNTVSAALTAMQGVGLASIATGAVNAANSKIIVLT